jgi:hypothetical protein
MKSEDSEQKKTYGRANLILTTILCIAALASAFWAAYSAYFSKQAAEIAENITERFYQLAATSYSPLITAMSKMQQTGALNIYYDTITIRNDRGQVSEVYAYPNTFISLSIDRIQGRELEGYRQIWLPIVGYFSSFNPTGLTQGFICDPLSANIPREKLEAFENDIKQSANRDGYLAPDISVVHCITIIYVNGFGGNGGLSEVHNFAVGEKSVGSDTAVSEKWYADISTEWQKYEQILMKDNAFNSDTYTALMADHLDGVIIWDLCRDHLLTPLTSR